METDQDRVDDDGNPTLDTVEEVGPLYETAAEQMEAVLEEFRVVARRAEAVGIVAIVAVCTSDPINREDRWNYACFGNSFTARGLWDVIRHKIFD